MLIILAKKIAKFFYYRFILFKLYNTYIRYKHSDEYLKYIHLLEAVNYSRVSQLDPIYFEFGCHSGRTFSAVINAFNFLKIKDYKVYAFDSFEGLPDTTVKDGYFKKGSFYTSIDNFIKIIKINTSVNNSSLEIIPGFYENSLNEELQSKIEIPSIIHIDVDLYSSCTLVLNFIKPILRPGTVILFDDWYCYPPYPSNGERKAFEEFLLNNPQIVTECWKSYSTFGKSFLVLSVD